MIKMHPLYSSSSGNMFHIETDKTDILIDIGVSYKAIIQGLKSINKDISDINGILITHEHIDHIKGISLLCRKNDIPIYACGDTATYLEDYLSEQNIKSRIIRVEYNVPFKILDFEITPFETSHDAVAPCGYDIYTNGKHVAYATDLGIITDDITSHFKNCDFAILEANYDKTMLEFGAYPFNTKRRIAGIKGHLSNEDSGKLIASMYNYNSKNYILSHMSENNNNIEMAKQSINCILEEQGINLEDISINFASKNLSSEEYTIL